MSIIYQNKITSAPTDGFSASLRETQDLFTQKHGTSIIGRNFEDILTSDSLYEEYIEKLTEGFEATDADQMAKMSKSARENILTESFLLELLF